MKPAKFIIVTLLLVSIIFVSGCTNQTDITSLVEKIPQVQNFLETNPDAEIKAVFWSKDFVETKIDLIREDCGEQMKIQDYYKVDLKTNSINLTLWLDTKDQTVLCAIKKGSNTTNENNTKTEVRKNCRELGGYLCGSEGVCCGELLNSSDSYCCPIQCGTCSPNENSNCTCIYVTDGRTFSMKCPLEIKCEADIYCCAVENGKPNCSTKLSRCGIDEPSFHPNNGICEEGEYFGSVTSCDGSSSRNSPPDNFESSDCPETCDDENPNTGDWYNFTAQRCEHKICSQSEKFPYVIKDYFENDYFKIEVIDNITYKEEGRFEFSNYVVIPVKITNKNFDQKQFVYANRWFGGISGNIEYPKSPLTVVCYDGCPTPAVGESGEGLIYLDVDKGIILDYFTITYGKDIVKIPL
jgi:hypothetical protein